MTRAWLALLFPLVAACGGGAPSPPVEARPFEDPGFVADGDFEMRYGTVLASELPEEVAARHGIERRSDRMVINLSVLQRRAGEVPLPVAAEVAGTWRGLVSEPRTLDFRAVAAHEAVSYLAVVPVVDGEVVMLELRASPPGAKRPLEARITRRYDTR